MDLPACAVGDRASESEEVGVEHLLRTSGHDASTLSNRASEAGALKGLVARLTEVDYLRNVLEGRMPVNTGSSTICRTPTCCPT